MRNGLESGTVAVRGFARDVARRRSLVAALEVGRRRIKVAESKGCATDFDAHEVDGCEMRAEIIDAEFP